MDIDHQVAYHHEDRGAVHAADNSTEQENPGRTGIELEGSHLAQDVRSTVGAGIGLVGTVATDVADVTAAGAALLPSSWAKSKRFLKAVRNSSAKVASTMKKAERVIEHPIKNGGSAPIQRSAGALKRKFGIVTGYANPAPYQKRTRASAAKGIKRKYSRR